MRRRDLLKAAPALALVGAAPEVASAHSDTPVMALFREWKAAQDAEDAAYADSLSDEETGRFGDIRATAEKRLMDQPCQTATDFICKVIAHTAFGVFCLPDPDDRPEFWAEARVLIGA